ncbi:MAG: thermonuclease family protein [Pseudodesulfovibrio sp.]|nr:thermonuclease family protein [Pseudodesulfovibrio sp.]
MSFRNTLFLASLILALFVFSDFSYAQNARFLTLLDGDSMLVEYNGYSQEVRLIGIDAPEWGQEYGTQAKAYAMNFCFGKTLRLELDKEKKDRYGRLLAYAYCGDHMLNEEMVRAGMALAIKVKPNTRYYSLLKKAEEKARVERRGFWLRGGLKMPPAQWRKKHPK